MRHAYLIMAHNEFEHLQRLIDALDDERNDIYVHIDKKVKRVPCLTTGKSRLTILNNRINVRWGDVSQIKAEYALFHAAIKNSPYDYYHIISGVHYPLMSLDKIDKFYSNFNGASVISPMPTSINEIKFRIGYRHFFMNHLTSSIKWLNKLYHVLWMAALYPQKKLRFSRKTTFVTGKSSQWCSLTDDAVKIILSHEKKIIKRLRFTFCCDEYLINTVLRNSGLPLVESDKLTYLNFSYGNASILNDSDFNSIIESKCLFARKFTNKSISLISKINKTKTTETC